MQLTIGVALGIIGNRHPPGLENQVLPSNLLGASEKGDDE
jgi:hypothetical protein